jgi:hypothetical protein
LAGLIEPPGRAWSDAPAADRLAFYKHAGELAVKAKRAELARAIGANGRRMKARKRPRPDGATGPVLTPHREGSRTSKLLAARPTASGVTLFWHAGLRKGQERPWGAILAFHARGAGKLPVRDVRLSRRAINALRAEMGRWWADRLAERRRLARNADRRGRRARAGPIRRAQEALARKYRSLKDYFREPGDGFRE